MSFQKALSELTESARVPVATKVPTLLSADQPMTGTPAGVAIGTALVAAAWTGAQVGDVAD